MSVTGSLEENQTSQAGTPPIEYYGGTPETPEVRTFGPYPPEETPVHPEQPHIRRDLYIPAMFVRTPDGSMAVAIGEDGRPAEDEGGQPLYAARQFTLGEFEGSLERERALSPRPRRFPEAGALMNPAAHETHVVKALLNELLDRGVIVEVPTEGYERVFTPALTKDWGMTRRGPAYESLDLLRAQWDLSAEEDHVLGPDGQPKRY